MNMCFLPPRLILQCDVINAEKGLHMKNENDETQSKTIIKICKNDENY